MSLAQVAEFHKAFGHPVATELNLINEERYKLRNKLIREELEETIRDYILGDLVKTADGLADMSVVINGSLLEFGFVYDPEIGDEYYVLGEESSRVPNIGSIYSLVKLANMIYDELDKMADLYYEGDVEGVVGCLIMMKFQVAVHAAIWGIPLKQIDEAVHIANMSKLGEDGKPIYRESDNKILKGPNFRPPEEDIELILRAHGAEL